MAQAAPAAPEAAPKEEKSKKAEEKSKCVSCNKGDKDLKRYYRDGKYFCSKKCWRAFKAKSKSEEAK